MRGQSGAVFVFAVTCVMAAGIWGARAESDPRSQEVVAKAGSGTITVGALEQRMRSVPDFQLATFGASKSDIRRQFLERVAIADALYAEGARAKNLEQAPAVRKRIDDALRAARLDDLRSEIAITPEETAAFYAQNRARFDSPERVAVFRILLPSREEAVKLLAEVKQGGALARWNDLARERSVDKATSMRGGNLGLLAADGSSTEASVRADPALFAAANRVKDGELVGEPVAEGNAFAVVWRRGSVPAVHRTVEQEAMAIRQILLRNKIEERTKALLAQLRAAHHVEVEPQLIDVLEVDSSGDLVGKKRPGVLPRKPTGAPAPSVTPRGLR
ncbi:MAG TPA: peptidylprolyl isomerase [Polyangiaceae bacterium]|nr:peptidylprolyl isomerase [Polyangiaceae bacterium]